jgi:hypothetical protein
LSLTGERVHAREKNAGDENLNNVSFNTIPNSHHYEAPLIPCKKRKKRSLLNS